jgi:DNA-binding beta-propeller fold protein YncE
MLSRKWILCAAVLASVAMLAGCDPDTEGNGTPVTGTRIWIADQPDKEVVMYDDSGNLLKTVGSRGIFSKPNAIDIYVQDGAAWISDFYTNRIRKFDASGNPLYASPDPNAGTPLVLNPVSLSVSQSTGECWVSDRGNNRLIRLDADGGVLARISGFKYPRIISADPGGGDVWVADEGNDAVVKVAATAKGDIDVRAVEVGSYTEMENPWAVAADADGKGWASSRTEGRVVRLSVEVAELASVGGFGAPVSLAVDETEGGVYVVDTDRGMLVGLPRNLTGTYEDFNAVATFVVGGLARPEWVYVDENAGRIYLAEMGAGNVRIYKRDGTLVKTISGFSGPAVAAAWSDK